MDKANCGKSSCKPSRFGNGRLACTCVNHGAMGTMRARRREAVVVRVGHRIVIRAEDGEQLGINDGIIFVVAALEFGIAVV